MALWQATIVENALKRLAALNKPFKYVVTCMISQNTGGATHTAHTCFWDAETDGDMPWPGSLYPIFGIVAD